MYYENINIRGHIVSLPTNIGDYNYKFVLSNNNIKTITSITTNTGKYCVSDNYNNLMGIGIYGNYYPTTGVLNLDVIESAPIEFITLKFIDNFNLESCVKILVKDMSLQNSVIEKPTELSKIVINSPEHGDFLIHTNRPDMSNNKVDIIERGNSARDSIRNTLSQIENFKKDRSRIESSEVNILPDPIEKTKNKDIEIVKNKSELEILSDDLDKFLNIKIPKELIKEDLRHIKLKRKFKDRIKTFFIKLNEILTSDVF